MSWIGNMVRSSQKIIASNTLLGKILKDRGISLLFISEANDVLWSET